VNGETHFANATELQVPAGIRDVVLNVRGLNDFRLKPHARKRAVPAYTGEIGTNEYVNYLVPSDWATIYGVNSIYAQSCGSGVCDGTGMYVGVVGQTYAPKSDITSFRSAAGLGTPNLIYRCISTSVNCTDTASVDLTQGNLDEADLDIEWSGGIAYNATVVFDYAAFDDKLGVFDALQDAVQTYKIAGKVLPVISMSYTDCEANFGGANSSDQAWVTSIGTQANSQGQTIVVASGDTGAFACDPNNGEAAATLGVYVSVPVDSPNYTGVGGTTLSGDESSPTTYWNDTVNSSTGILVNSALKYIPESAWNDTSLGYGLSASGGGLSMYYPQPTWQNGLISGETSGRMVPDVAFAASPYHDGYLTCSQADNSTKYGNDCATGFLSTKNYWDVMGGTSAATPSFAGMLTLLVQKYGNLGNINLKLYQLAANSTTYASVFNDITSGNNDVPCTVETSDTGCPSSGEFGYAAATGYDMVTGLGSINGYALYTALGGSSGPSATTTTAQVSPTSVALGGTTTLTAAVSSTTSGTISGIVTFKVGSTSLGSATISSGVATLSNVVASAAKGFSTGTDTITASYGGSTLFAASSGSTPLTVTLPSTTTTATVTPTSVATGGTVTLKATVSSGLATPAGTVMFTSGSATLGTATLSSGVATLSNVTATAANGLGLGEDMVTANYEGSASFAASSGSTEVVVYNPALPLPLSLAPTGATAGGAGFTLTVNGGNFASTSLVLWNGLVRKTTYVNSTELQATINAADIAKEGTNLVTVANLTPQPGTSSAMPFAVQSSKPVATITGASVSLTPNGSGVYILTLTGTDFVTASVVEWKNASSLPTSYVSPWQISATLTASEYALLPAAVTVVNPSGTSTAFRVP
jgi:subtilase family serine protease